VRLRVAQGVGEKRTMATTVRIGTSLHYLKSSVTCNPRRHHLTTIRLYSLTMLTARTLSKDATNGCQ